MTDRATSPGSSPYATGGGGVILEQHLAAEVLASVLLAESVTGLGDDFTASRVGLQQEMLSPVDDIYVEGESPTGTRRFRIACRRKPRLTASSDATVKLFSDFLVVVHQERAELEAGSLRLGLAVAGPFGPARQLATLADLARRQPDRETFERAVRAPGAYASKVRDRLDRLDELIAEALRRSSQAGEDEGSPAALSWFLLRSLFVIETQFEGDSAPGRTNLVARLQALTGTASAAADLRLRLVEIAGQGAIRAGLLDQAALRRELIGFGRLNGSRNLAPAKDQIDTLEAEFRQRTRSSLQVPGSDEAIVLDRGELRAKVIAEISSLDPGGVLILRGEPGVGKSSLSIGIADDLRAAGESVLAMSLRSLPLRVIDFKTSIGLTPHELMAAAPSSDLGTLIFDGGETLQEQAAGAFEPLLVAAEKAGRRTVVVTRDDALESIQNTVTSVIGSDVATISVPPLDGDEILEITRAAPVLGHLAEDERSRWLLRRLGLVELLLKSAGAGASLPKSLSSEAEVFRVVWASLVRNGERHVGAVSPDDREAALLRLAKDLVCGGAEQPRGAAPASLRSDGLLHARGPSSPWQRGDEFASDIIRDFAVARLLLQAGLQEFSRCGAPRWAIRGARLYAQSRVAEALANGIAAVPQRWKEVNAEFDALSAQHGARWRQVPWEAVLVTGWADQVLASVGAESSDQRSVLLEAIECIEIQFSSVGACDWRIGAPVVRQILRLGHLAEPRIYGDDPWSSFLCSWLRSVARLRVQGVGISALHPLLRSVRDELLTRAPERGENERIECLGLLVTVPSSHLLSTLRQVAENDPGNLWSVVESLDAAALMAREDPSLLAELTEAYYIERPADLSRGSRLLDDGIRRHRGGGISTPLAAWYRGPFLFLLRANWSLGLDLIEKMVDHGTRIRKKNLLALDGPPSASGGAPAHDRYAISLALLGHPERLYHGDPHVWSWYRGTSVGPYPCMSALYSLEMNMDERVKSGESVRQLAADVLQAATTLASAGLVYGFLVRHIADVEAELDGFLSSPEVWHLEFGRTISEGRNLFHDADSSSATGPERRTWTPRDVAAQLVFDAQNRDDQESLARLRAVGRYLVDRAGGDSAPPEVLQWAAHLDWDSYEVEVRPDGVVLQVNPSQDVADALADAQQESQRVMQLYSLLGRYRPMRVTPYRYALRELPADFGGVSEIHAARKLADEIAPQPFGQVTNALGGLAAAVVVGGCEDADQEQIDWALAVLVDAAGRPNVESRGGDRSTSPDGADRIAALALPQALSAVDEGEAVAVADVGEALQSLTASHCLEVRENAAEGIGQVFEHECYAVSEDICWHQLAWDAVVHGARNVRLGPWENGRRPVEAISGDLVNGLDSAATEDLLLTHITPAATAAVRASAETSCIGSAVDGVRSAVLRAYARTAVRWAEENYTARPEQEAALASAIANWAGAVGSHVLFDLLESLSGSARALGDFLHAMTVVATYEPSTVSILQEAWPRIMRMGLDLLHQESDDNGWGRETLVRNLIPDPAASTNLGNFDEVFMRARSHWLHIEAVTPHIDEWLTMARGNRWSVDALVGFLEAQPESLQVLPGLGWVRDLVISDSGRADNPGFLLIPWLQKLQLSPELDGQSRLQFRILVDGLAIAGFPAARDLQQDEE